MNFSVNAKELEKTETESPDGTEAVGEEAKRPGIVSKKMILITSVVCGGIAFLIWAMLGFPRKFKILNSSEETRCNVDTLVCPKDWHRVYNRCFFESEQHATWANSQAKCMAHRGSLIIFSSQNEVDFLTYYLGTSSYWIGLKKHNASGHWMWANGVALNNRFKIEGSGDCAFIYRKGISTTNCDDEKWYICNKKGVCP